MSWVKLDDQFFVNRKAVAAGLEGRAMFVASVCYCGMQLNNGKFEKAALPVIAAMAGVDLALADRLFAVELWHDLGHSIEVHDYLKYNPSREQAIAAQERAKKAAGARWNAQSNADSNSPPGDSAMPIPSRSPDNSISSSSDLRAVPNGAEERLESIFALFADRQTAQHANGNPTGYRKATLKNARQDYTERVLDWLTRYEVSDTQVSDALAGGGAVPPSWNHCRRSA